MHLVQRRGVSIDLETKEGYTILLGEIDRWMDGLID